MAWNEWRQALIGQLAFVFGMSQVEAQKYVEDTGDECWREAFNDGLSPEDAALEELNAAAEAI